MPSTWKMGAQSSCSRDHQKPCKSLSPASILLCDIINEMSFVFRWWSWAGGGPEQPARCSRDRHWRADWCEQLHSGGRHGGTGCLGWQQYLTGATPHPPRECAESQQSLFSKYSGINWKGGRLIIVLFNLGKCLHSAILTIPVRWLNKTSVLVSSRLPCFDEWVDHLCIYWWWNAARFPVRGYRRTLEP